MGLFNRLRGGRGADDGDPYTYPLVRTNERTYPDDFEGDVFIWDIDKTYLVSEFDSVRGLLAIPFEFAVDKRNIAATDTLLRALRRGVGDDGTTRSNPLYFISASPVQLRPVITRKMLRDGVEYDGVTFKDHLAILRARKVSRIKEQVGYKLSALLLNRRELPWRVREVLFGDDSESDALIYALYADIVAGRLRGDPLLASLVKNRVDPEDAAFITTVAADLPKAELVKTIYINLEKRSPPERFAAWGARLVPCYDTFQMALHLFEAGMLDEISVVAVGTDLVERHGRSALGVLRSALDLIERHAVAVEVVDRLWDALRAAALVPPYVRLDSTRDVPAPDRKTPEFATPLAHLDFAGETPP